MEHDQRTSFGRIQMKHASGRLRLARWGVFCVTALFLAASATIATAADPIKVAIYDHSDGSARGPKNLRKVLSDTEHFECIKVTPEEIRNGALDKVDVLIMPGGSGSGQAKKLEESGRERIREFVRNGGGYIGICAGSYLASSCYDWSLNLINAEVIDRAHWARGTGQVILSLTPEGQKLLGNSEPEVEVYYGQGPLLGPNNTEGLPPYESLAKYKTEIAKKGAPSGVMPGTDAIARAPYGKGRVFCFSPHCEVSEGPNFMVVNAVLWVSKNEDRNVPSAKEPKTATTKKEAPAATVGAGGQE